MNVRLDAVLYVAQLVVELLADGARLAVLADDVAFAHLGVVNLEDRADYGRCAACTSFLKCVKFFLWYLAALNLKAEVKSQLLEALVGDGGEDGGRLWRDVGVVLYSKEICRTTLVNVFLLLCIKIELA